MARPRRSSDARARRARLTTLWRAAALTFCFGLPLGVPVACGARSDLAAASSGSSDVDGGTGGGVDADIDADGGTDAKPDVFVRDCDPEAGVTYIYLVTERNQMFSFDPASGELELRGNLDCPTVGPTPFSMAVDRKGTAYVLFDDGRLYRVRVANGSCEETEYVPGQLDFGVFGMGFATDQAGPEETLYVAEINPNGPSDGLGRIDVESLELAFVAPFSQTFGRIIELTGTGDGRLFGYFLSESGPGGHVVEIDKESATIVSSTPVGVGAPSSALAFAFWGGDFYIFTTKPGGIGTDVTRYDPDDESIDAVTSLSATVVGAGVSTCAPQ